ncbi:MAG: nucleic acid-binding protein contains PIN protein [uncultured bacterium]|nr:MAG: nucleic acid-binding protein contains PIN protein [uncultured bacterium]
MKPQWFIDSSALFAWMDASSREGKKIESLLGPMDHSLITTNLVFAETISLITKRVSKLAGVQAGQSIFASKLVHLSYLDLKTQQEAWKMYVKYKDKDFDFIDATSFVFCQQNKIKEVLTLDHHFTQMGFKILP